MGFDLVTFLWLNGVFILYDVFSCVLAIRSQVRGRGFSPVPIITLFGYAWVAIKVPDFSVMAKMLMFGLGVLIHALLQFAIPLAHLSIRNRWMARGR